jgi:hypothetical protein
VQGTDGTIVQIGDTDSGRFFKLHPTLVPNAAGAASDSLSENTLDHSGFATAVDALFGDASGETMDAVLVRRLIGAQAPIEASPSATPFADFGDVDALIARWQAAPEISRRVRRVPFAAPVEPSTWSRAVFPDFGLYLFRQQGRLIAFRCAGAPPKAAPRGHRHDDNLSIEYRLGPAERRDPGSFVYTPSVVRRNEYRAASAHDAPRIRGRSLAQPGASLFDLYEVAGAHCLCWRPNAVAGEVRAPFGTMLRIVQLAAQELVIFDCVSPGEIDDVPPPLPVSRGYGQL